MTIAAVTTPRVQVEPRRTDPGQARGRPTSSDLYVRLEFDGTTLLGYDSDDGVDNTDDGSW